MSFAVKLILNGTVKEFSAVDTLLSLLGQLGIDYETGGVAVAVNGAVVPKARWSATSLADGDDVEIIHAVQGG